MSKGFWIIEVYDNTKLLSSHRVPLSALNQRQVEDVLRFLSAKHALTDEEIIGSLARKNSSLRMEHLEVQYYSGGPFTMSCGSDPYVVARVDAPVSN